MAALVGNIRGPQGAQGAQGPTGPEGPTGPTGPEGPQGPQGAAGTGITMQGSVPTVGDLPPTGNAQGDAYIVEADDSLHIWDGTAWVSGGSIQGPPGAQGPQGPQGATGSQGPSGPRGTGWFTGSGAPVEPISGSIAGDLYLDVSSGDVYELVGA